MCLVRHIPVQTHTQIKEQAQCLVSKEFHGTAQDIIFQMPEVVTLWVKFQNNKITGRRENLSPKPTVLFFVSHATFDLTYKTDGRVLCS